MTATPRTATKRTDFHRTNNGGHNSRERLAYLCKVLFPSLYSPTKVLANLTRLQTCGGPILHWVQVAIDPNSEALCIVQPVMVRRPWAGQRKPVRKTSLGLVGWEFLVLFAHWRLIEVNTATLRK